jgi:hypothetical protein
MYLKGSPLVHFLKTYKERKEIVCCRKEKKVGAARCEYVFDVHTSKASSITSLAH